MQVTKHINTALANRVHPEKHLHLSFVSTPSTPTRSFLEVLSPVFVLLSHLFYTLQGSQEIFQELPHEYVPPEMLRKVAEHGSMSIY